jgi:hypothetical protein
MLKALGVAVIASLVVTSRQSHEEVQRKERRAEYHTIYRTQQIDGLSFFYRGAGPKDAPTLLLLHGLPSSSRIVRVLSMCHTLTRHEDRLTAGVRPIAGTRRGRRRTCHSPTNWHTFQVCQPKRRPIR